MPRSRAFLTFFMFSVAGCTCASNPEVVPRDGGIRDGDIVLEDGRVVVQPDPPAGPCGGLGEQCCPGASCDEGLNCCGNSLCLGVPRGSTCAGDGDCCPGLTCAVDDGVAQCLSERGGPCIGSSDCVDGEVCDQGICGGPPVTMPQCGGDGEPCCIRTVDGENVAYCTSGFVCDGETGGDCVACGAPGQPCCDGETRCPEQANTFCIVRQTGNPSDPTTETCEIPVDCGEVGEACCGGDGCVSGAICESGNCFSEEEGCIIGDEPECCGASTPSGDPQRCCEDQRCDPGFSCVAREDDSVEGGVRRECIPFTDVINDDRNDPDGDGDCGASVGDRCCLPSGSCQGGLSCETLTISFDTGINALSCQDCQPAGSGCGSSTSIFGEDQNRGSCCGGQVCDRGRCAGGQFGSCNPRRGSLACAGEMECEPLIPEIPFISEGVGFCQPREGGESCEPGDCANFAKCVDGVCQDCSPTTTMCGSLDDCCTGFNCQPTTQSGGQNVCCSPVAGACTDDDECCGGSFCALNQCQCVPVAPSLAEAERPCLLDTDCCEDEMGSQGRCAINQGSRREGDLPKYCVPSDAKLLGDECGASTECFLRTAVRCAVSVPGESEDRCCILNGTGQRCDEDDQCCGGRTCGPDGECILAASGQACEGGDCEAGTSCVDDRCQ